MVGADFQGGGDQVSVSKSSEVSAWCGSLLRMILAFWDLKGSSVGMRSSQRWWESFSWPEKSKRMRTRTFAASALASADLGDFFLEAAGLAEESSSPSCSAALASSRSYFRTIFLPRR